MSGITRRGFLGTAAGSLLLSRRVSAMPPAKVAVMKCRSYDAELLPAMERMFDQLGGLGRFVKSKTVAVKINLTGVAETRLRYAPAEDSHFTHPRAIAALAYLMSRAGARRIRFLECCHDSADSMEEFMLRAGWEPRQILNAAPRVELENTNCLGGAKKYSRLNTPGGGYIFKGFDLNHSFADCDVFVSFAKMKEHETTGVTLSMKNCFGNTPCTIYGAGAPENEPGDIPRGGRNPFHIGDRQPSKSAPGENDPKSPREAGYRVPRIVTDIVAARPIDLAIIEGVRTMTGGEGPWVGNFPIVEPGMLVAGANCVSTDAVSMALMGFDPLADRGRAPFEKSDSTLKLAEEAGLGTRDLKRIEVVGTPIRDLVFPFRAHRQSL